MFLRFHALTHDFRSPIDEVNMSDILETSPEAQEQQLQPTDAVTAEVEESTASQGEDDNIVIDVDEQEGDQQENAKGVDWHKAMQKEKAAKRRKTELLNAEREEKERLQRKVEELESKINPLINPKPTLEQHDYDNESYEKAISDYYQNKASKSSSEKAEPEKDEPNQFNDQNFEADYYLKKNEEAITKNYPKYSEDRAQLLEKFNSAGGNDNTFIYLSGIALEAGVDIAKANIALNSSSALFEDLVKASETGSHIRIADVLRSAEKKVKFNARKNIDTKPEPTINGKKSQLVSGLDQFGQFD